jgi:hypothetical protein
MTSSNRYLRFTPNADTPHCPITSQTADVRIGSNPIAHILRTVQILHKSGLKACISDNGTKLFLELIIKICFRSHFISTVIWANRKP